MGEPTDVVVRGGIAVRRLDADALPIVSQALDAAEAEAGAPLVDESERRRLAAASADPTGATPGWTSVAAYRGAAPVGYAAFVAAALSDDDATPLVGRGDAAALTADPARAVLGALLAAVRTLAADAGCHDLDVWVRQGGDREVDAAVLEGFEVARRLGVLGRHLDDLPGAVEAPAHGIRGYRPEEDDGAVVEVLAAAYEGTPEAGWDLAMFQERRDLPWFRREDLLVAVDDDDRIDGLHWLKRRDATTGEVYNLAIHPRAQGGRLGPALLSAGLHHLREVGCSQVMLWVDRANERAVGLYERHGFATRWDDLAFRATLA
jgi:mycothiol synthase